MSSINKRDDAVCQVSRIISASIPDTRRKVGTIPVDELYDREILERRRNESHDRHKLRITIEEERTSHQDSIKVSRIRSKLRYRKIRVYVAFILGLAALLYVIVEYWPILKRLM